VQAALDRPMIADHRTTTPHAGEEFRAAAPL
jgi:hypothetical protein